MTLDSNVQVYIYYGEDDPCSKILGLGQREVFRAPTDMLKVFGDIQELIEIDDDIDQYAFLLSNIAEGAPLDKRNCKSISPF